MLPQDIVDRTFHSPQGEQGFRVCEILLDAGFEAWWVGGCVRDLLLDEIPKDVDIATNATPEDVIKLFPKNDSHAANLGSVIVSLKGETYEVTTFREDADASNGRLPESINFCSREEDAKRRDITINALYWNPISSELYDPFDGKKDLNEKLIRFIGDPNTRIKEDALRLLRVIRFRSQINGQYHPDTFKALHLNAKSVLILSGERRFKELEKMLLGPHPEIAFEDLWETDIIEYLIPELHACKGVGQPSKWHGTRDVWEHSMATAASFTDDHNADVRWAALLHDIGKPATFSIEDDRIHFNNHAKTGAELTSNLLSKLQCNSKRKDKISWLIAHHMMMATFEDLSVERKSHWYYHPWFMELLQIFWLDIAGGVTEDFSFYESIIKDYNKFLDEHPLPPKPILTGKDVMEILGIQPGERVGEIMKLLYDAQINKEVTSKKEATEFLENLKK